MDLLLASEGEMQVSMILTAIHEDEEYEGVYHATYKIEGISEARSLSSRLGISIVVDMPDPQPPDVYAVSVPEEEAQVNEPKGKKR